MESKGLPILEGDKGGSQEEEKKETVSKKQRKRELKQEKWVQQKEALKMKRKEKKKKSKSYIRSQFEELPEGKESDKLSKPERVKLFKDLCAKGPKYVIDCDFEDLMQEKELRSLGQQLAYCYSANKKADQPINLILTGVGAGLKEILGKANAQNWACQIEYGKSYLDCANLKREKLVYLTADSENLIQDLDGDKIYIIGGIVDHNRHKKLTWNKANQQKIAHARLPIQENVKLSTSAVLTVNHVFEIIAEYLQCRDWKQTLTKVIPDRKIIDNKPEKKGGKEESEEEKESEKEEAKKQL